MYKVSGFGTVDEGHGWRIKRVEAAEWMWMEAKMEPVRMTILLSAAS